MAKYTVLLPNGTKRSFSDAGSAVVMAMGNVTNNALRQNYADALRSGTTVNVDGITIIPENVTPGAKSVTRAESSSSDILKGFGAMFIMFFGFYIMGLIANM